MKLSGKKILFLIIDKQVSTPYFSFPSPSRQEKLRRSRIYGSLRRQGSSSRPELHSYTNDDNDDPFFTPDSDDKSIYKSLRKETIAPSVSFPENNRNHLALKTQNLSFFRMMKRLNSMKEMIKCTLNYLMESNSGDFH